MGLTGQTLQVITIASGETASDAVNTDSFNHVSFYIPTISDNLSGVATTTIGFQGAPESTGYYADIVSTTSSGVLRYATLPIAGNQWVSVPEETVESFKYLKLVVDNAGLAVPSGDMSCTAYLRRY